jgi:L-threonylcarbamoyladenylate synthase
MAAIGTDIEKAIQLLQQNELVAIPTETVYGLAGNALNTQAVTKIFAVKDRPQFDPLIIHVPNLEKVFDYIIDIPDAAIKLAQTFWPGPLTLLLKKKTIIPDLVTSGLDTVGIRCPDHALTRTLLQQLPFPLAAPSANPFGYVSPTKPEHVNEQLGEKIQYILDGGVCPVGIESTIVGFEHNNPIVYRLGGLSIEAIEETIGKVTLMTHSSSNPKAPGQLKSHYAPRKKMILGSIDELLKTHHPDRTGVLSFQQTYPVKHQITLAPSGKTEEAAQHLFEALRTLDKLDIDSIVAELVPEIGLGKAINDRLRRAAAH